MPFPGTNSAPENRSLGELGTTSLFTAWIGIAAVGEAATAAGGSHDLAVARIVNFLAFALS